MVKASGGLLFDPPALPDGFRHADEFLDPDEERMLVERFGALDFHEVRMRGVAARRRVIQYGWKYSFESFRMTEGLPVPDYLAGVRDRAVRFAGLADSHLSEALITE